MDTEKSISLQVFPACKMRQVQGAIQAYEALPGMKPDSVKDLLRAQWMVMDGWGDCGRP
jgi:hypothetical protein